MSHAEAPIDPLADWRKQMAVNELQQALEFDSGERDAIFHCEPDAIQLRRSGAVMGCVRTALAHLTNSWPTLKGRRQEHEAGVCDAFCPHCNPQDYS